MAIILWQEILILRVSVGVDIRLEGGDNVGVFRGRDGLEKHVGAVAPVEENLLFGLEPELELVAMTEC